MNQLPVASLSASPNEYLNLWAACVINAGIQPQIDEAVKRIKSHSETYTEAVNNTRIPWYCVGIMDEMECSCNQSQHIHNGDPLTAKTVQVPAGRPAIGEAPFTKLQSISDWITLKKWHQYHDWDVASILYRMELNNGFGYRRYRINTPYLWAGSNLYAAGKYVSDGSFSRSAISKQIGAALLLKQFI